MKTRQEMIYDFMLATVTNPDIAQQCDSKLEFAKLIYEVAENLTDKFLENAQ
jgi:hypothetical protein